MASAAQITANQAKAPITLLSRPSRSGAQRASRKHLPSQPWPSGSPDGLSGPGGTTCQFPKTHFPPGIRC